MRELLPISSDCLEQYPTVDEAIVDALLKQELDKTNRKVIALDDDPTGVQTVHGVYVYTTWDPDAFLNGFENPDRLFFIMTNSRSMTVSQTTGLHREIAANLARAAHELDQKYILISRSDSTLRGHYPLETKILREELEKSGSIRFDGEIILPFFKEGGRYTINNVHYVLENDRLTPAGQTEFAKDLSFGYTASDLREWIEEKTGGTYRASDVCCVSLQQLRGLQFNEIQDALMGVRDFNKIVVNAIDYVDVKIFAIAYLRAVRAGKEFLFRSAAAVTKVLGGISDAPMLNREDLIEPDNRNGGIVIIGSHVNKTTKQLECLKQTSCPISFIQFDQHLVLKPGGLEEEIVRVDALAEDFISSGRSVVIYTRRDRFDLNTDDKDKQLEVSVKISDALTSVIRLLTVRPSFIIAKGGITSSDVGTKALQVKRAEVMGQISPGVPVWMTGPESKFPSLPYVIFPGNVGNEDTLRQIVETLA